MKEIKLGDTVKVLHGKFKDEIGVVVGVQMVGGGCGDFYYEVDMKCKVPEEYNYRKTLITPNNVIGGLNADDIEVVESALPKHRLIPKDYFNKCLELQEKLTTLKCECKRFADYVMNLSHDSDPIAIQFEDEYLRMAGNMLYEAFVRKQSIKDIDPTEIIKELKK